MSHDTLIATILTAIAFLTATWLASAIAIYFYTCQTIKAYENNKKTNKFKKD